MPTFGYIGETHKHTRERAHTYIYIHIHTHTHTWINKNSSDSFYPLYILFFFIERGQNCLPYKEILIYLIVLFTEMLRF